MTSMGTSTMDGLHQAGNSSLSLWNVPDLPNESEEMNDWERQNQDLFDPGLGPGSGGWKSEESVMMPEEQPNVHQPQQQLYPPAACANLRPKTCELHHCAELAASLTQTSHELRAKSQIITQKEYEFARLEMTLRQELEMKVLESREAARRTEDDFKLEARRLYLERDRLKEDISLLRHENETLATALKAKDAEIEDLKKSSLTKEQTTTLLRELKTIEEKYELAHRSKMFFKEQWARAMREVHYLRSRHRQELVLQIMSNKEELRAFGKMLPEAKKTSDFDRTEIKTVDNPDNNNESSEHKNVDQSSNNETLHQSKSECKLQELVQERDTLLNTGNYGLDHVLITKINKEIRQILTECNSKFI